MNVKTLGPLKNYNSVFPSSKLPPRLYRDLEQILHKRGPVFISELQDTFGTGHSLNTILNSSTGHSLNTIYGTTGMHSTLNNTGGTIYGTTGLHLNNTGGTIYGGLHSSLNNTVTQSISAAIDYLRHIPSLDKITYKPQFTSCSKDKSLLSKSTLLNTKYCSSTSSINHLLVPFHYLLQDRTEIDFNFSKEFEYENRLFSPFQRSCHKVNLKFVDGVYCVEALEESKSNVLMELGHVLELFLTSTPEEFISRTTISSSESTNHSTGINTTTSIENTGTMDTTTSIENTGTMDTTTSIENTGTMDTFENIYHYAKVGNFLLRSQLDSHHPSLPFKTFDLKTRATHAIRHDISNYSNHTWYTIKHHQGLYESFEREKFDLCKSGFLKYALQARVGNMDGIFIAYHNINEIFGFEYFSLGDIDDIVYGSSVCGEQSFSLSMQLVESVLDKISSVFGEENVEVLVSSPRRNSAYILATPFGSNESNLDGTAKRPLILHLSTHSTVNGKHSDVPIVYGSEEWKVEYELKEIEFNKEVVGKLEKEYSRLHGNRKSGSINGRKKRDFRGIVEQYYSSLGSKK